MITEKKVDPALANVSVDQIKRQMVDVKEQYKIAKENFEFMQASMLLDDIRILHKELDRRRAW